MACNWHKPFLKRGNEENGRRNDYIINLHESMGLGWDQTHDAWIYNWTCYQLHYGARISTGQGSTNPSLAPTLIICSFIVPQLKTRVLNINYINQNICKMVASTTKSTTTIYNNEYSNLTNWLFAPWEFFRAFLSSTDFIQNQLFRKILSGIPPACQTDWIQIRPYVLSGLI